MKKFLFIIFFIFLTVTCASGGGFIEYGDGGSDSAVGQSSVCGDGQISGLEACDGINLNNMSCASLGEGIGTLTCNPNTCTYDVSMCHQESPSTTAGYGG